MNLSLSDLQDQVDEWTSKNFGRRIDRKRHHPLLGLQEEIRELAHAHLKMEQGIRGMDTEHSAAKMDAIGDILIYLADYCNMNGLDLATAVTVTWLTVQQRDWIKNPVRGKENKSAT